MNTHQRHTSSIKPEDNLNFDGDFNRFDPHETPDVSAGVSVRDPHKFYNNFSEKNMKMEEFREKLLNLMSEYDVKTWVSYGEYEGVSFIWFVDASNPQSETPIDLLDLPNIGNII